MYDLEFKVRDYECDIQGIVNNSVYQNYLEHARHEFLLGRGIDFAQLAKEGINLVVTRIEMDYKAPLKSGDLFKVTVAHEALGRIRGSFKQQIIRKKDQQLIVDALVQWVAVNDKGRPIAIPQITQLLEA